MVLKKCPPPQVSYASALRAINILPIGRLFVSDAGGEISRGHLAGLNHVETLVLTKLNLTFDAFEATPKLQYLRLDSVKPNIERLPTTLKELLLMNTGVTRLDRAVLADLKNLMSLVVRDDHATVTVEATAPLQDLALQGKAVFLDDTLPDTLLNVTLFQWGESTPVPWKTCNNLQKLEVQGAQAKILPDGWLANCKKLQILLLQDAPALTSLAPGALQNASALQTVSLTNSALVELPPEVLYGSTSLVTLDLSRNKLNSIPAELLYDAILLHSLNLSRNNLSGLLT